MSNDTFVNDYLKWLKNRITTRKIGDWIEISTPFLDRHNDGIVIYACRDNDGHILLSDDGYTLDDLEMCGYSINTVAKKNVLSTLLHKYGVMNYDNVLQVKADDNNFPQQKHNLIQAIININNMALFPKYTADNNFTNDIANFLDVNNILHIRDMSLRGKSGLSHNLDFIIPKTKEKPERIIIAVNTPDTNNAKITLFAWSDLVKIRPSNLLYIFLNDKKSIRTEIIEAYTNYKTHPIKWTHRKQSISELAA